MDKNIEEKIKQFIDRISKKYSGIIFKYEFYKNDNCYEITHNSYYNQFKESIFLKDCGVLLKELFENNNIHNVYFAYSLHI